MNLDSHRLPPASRYALLLVDLCIGFTDPARSPLAVECTDVVAANARLLDAFRQRGWPVLFTTVAYDHPSQARVFRRKLPALNLLESGSGLVRIDPRVAPLPSEPVLVKHWPSAFFATDLATRLRTLDVDGLMLTGLTTSGCVRASTLDALQHEWPVLLPAGAIGDRDQAAHHASLHDLGLKYADVADVDECLARLH